MGLDANPNCFFQRRHPFIFALFKSTHGAGPSFTQHRLCRHNQRTFETPPRRTRSRPATARSGAAATTATAKTMSAATAADVDQTLELLDALGHSRKGGTGDSGKPFTISRSRPMTLAPACHPSAMRESADHHARFEAAFNRQTCQRSPQVRRDEEIRRRLLERDAFSLAYRLGWWTKGSLHANDRDVGVYGSHSNAGHMRYEEEVILHRAMSTSACIFLARAIFKMPKCSEIKERKGSLLLMASGTRR